MKRLLLAVAICLFLSTSAYALLDTINNRTNSPSSDASATASQLQGQGQIQGQGQGQGQGQLQAATAAQGQQQLGEVKTTTKVEVGGDTTKDNYAIAFPSTASAEGTSNAQATYLFGSLGKSNTETFKKLIPEIQAILAIPDAVMAPEMKKDIVGTLVKKMLDANRTQRFLGFMWEDNSKNLLNMFGLLCWDSVWSEGQKPFQSKSDAGLVPKPVKETPAVKTVDAGVTGNAGILPVGNQK
jgi:hypothetical protein